jgi:hypothetical protein
MTVISKRAFQVCEQYITISCISSLAAHYKPELKLLALSIDPNCDLQRVIDTHAKNTVPSVVDSALAKNPSQVRRSKQ